MRHIVECIRSNHKDCLVQSCVERKCGLRLDGVRQTSLAIIHGTKYQQAKQFTERLCDRILFYGEQGFILAAVELKGGKNVHISTAVQQIQNGLSIAEGILEQHPVADWFPILLYSGSIRNPGTRLLRTKSVEFRGKRKNVIRKDCGTELRAILSG